MEHNQEKKINKKSLIPLIACLVVVAACALCTVGVLISRNLGSDKEVAKETEEIVIEQNESGEMLATNEATLRKLLLEDTTYTIAITDDIYVNKPLEVNGTKTLVGDKSIIMDLNTAAKERVLSVSEDAHLILDGATIDGNGVSSGIAVKDGGKLDCLSGSIVYPMPYGIVTEGTVNVEDILIDRSMHTGIYVEAGGELYMTGGKITNCIQTGIATSTKAYAKVSKDAVIQKSAGSLFYNYGTLDITGGVFSDSYSNCIYNKGELNIISETDKLVEFFNSGRSVISSVAGTTVTIDGLYVHDIAAHAMNLEKDSVGDVKNVLVENTGKSSFYANSSKLTMKDVELKDIKSVGINVTNKSTVELENITVLNGGHRGIINDTSNVTMKNITIDNMVGAGIVTIGEKSTTTIEKAKISKVGKSGIGITGGTVTAKDIEITDAAGTSVYTSTANSKTTINGAKLVNSGKSAIGVSIGTVTAQNVEINGTKNTGVYIQKGAKLNLTDATIKGANKHGIANYFGTVVTKNVSIESPKNAGILNQGTLTGEKVTINKAGSRAMSLTAASSTNVKGLVINESKNQSVYIDNVTKVNISDFAIDKSGQSAFLITKSTDVLLKSGTITNANGDGIWVSEKAKIKVQDTTITKPTKHGVEIVGEGAEVTAINVTVDEPARAGLVNNGGTINGNIVKIKDSGSRAVSLINKSTSSLTGLTVVNAGDQAVYVDGTTKVVLKEFEIDTTKNAAIRVANADNVSIKTGTIKNAGTDAVYAGKASAIKVEAVDIADAVKYGINCENGNITAIDVNVKNAKAGIVNKGGIIAGNTVSVADTVGRGMSLTEGSTTDITGLNVKNTGDQAVYVDGTTKVVLKDIAIDKTKSAAIRVANADNVSIKGGTIKNVGTNAVYAGKDAAMKVEAVAITDTTEYGLYCEKGNLTAINVNVTNAKAGIVNKGGIIAGNTVSVADTVGRGMSLTEGSTTDVTGLTVKNTGDQGVYVENSKVKFTTFAVDKTKSAAFSLGKTKEIDEKAVENATLTNGTIKNSGSTGIYIAKTATANVTDVTIENAGQHGIQNAGGKLTGTTVAINQTKNRALTMSTGAEVTINGLGIKGTGIGNEEKKDAQAVYVDGGKESKVQITGFEISDALQAAVRIRNTKGVKLTDGIINATTYGIYTSEDASAVAEGVRILRQAGNKDALIHIESTSSLTLKNGENTVAEKQSLVDGQGFDGQGVVVAGTFTLNGGTITGHGTSENPSTKSAAGVYVKSGATFTMNGANAIVEKNYSTQYGAGVVVAGEATFELKSGKIQYNESAGEGAGVYVADKATFTMSGDNSYIQYNAVKSGANGGGAVVYGTFNLNGGELYKNTAQKGAGIFVRGTGTLTMTDGKIWDNTAADYGKGENNVHGGGLYVLCDADHKVEVKGGTIQGNTANYGGGVYVNGQFVVTGGSIEANTATKGGSGVYVLATKGEQQFTMSGGTITGHGKEENRNNIVGNAVYVNENATFKMSGTADISLNYSTEQGNAVYVLKGGTFTMDGGTIKENNTTDTGSVSVNGSFTMNGGDIKDNHASKNAGGVIIRSSGSFSMTGGTVDGNTTGGNGGGIYIQSTDTEPTISGGTIQNNEAGNGGGIYLDASSSSETFYVKSGALITANKASVAGAGVYANKGTFTMEGGSITNHGTSTDPSAAKGAGVYINSKLSMTSGTISDNYTEANGGGVYLASGAFNMSGSSTLQNNTSTADGGAVYVAGGTYTLNNGTENTIYQNEANNGGAVAVAGGTFHLKKGNIIQNEATMNGGGVYVASGTFKTSEASVKTISNNTAGNFGGGLYLAAGTTCELDGSKLSFNANSATRGKDMYLLGQITLKSALTDEISISPLEYSTNTVIATGTINDTFKASMKKFAVEKAVDNTYWYVGEDGKLAQASIGVGANGVGYATLAEAVAAAANGDTITLIQDQEITEGITVTKNLTLTSATPVTISANFDSSTDLFTVAEGGTLAINGASAESEITLVGGTNTNYVINNSGTLLMSNVNITGGVRGIQHTKGTLGTENNPLTNVSVSNASKQGIRIESGTAQIQSANINDSGNYGLVVKGGTVTVKNTVIDNAGVTTTNAARIGIAAHGGTLTLDNVTIQHFRGTDGNGKTNNNHGVELAYSGNLIVTANEPDSKGLHISDVKGHGIYAHYGSNGGMAISKISIDGNAKTTRAGIQMTNCGTQNDMIKNATITECNAPIQLKSASVTIEDKYVQETEGNATNYNTDGTPQ